VVDISPLPYMARNYCYAHRVLYIEKQTFMGSFADDYDISGKPWKLFMQRFRPEALNEGDGSVAPSDGDTTNAIWDLQNDHTTVGFSITLAQFNSAVPAEYRNVERYALPGGLAQIMQ
jgi:hypothetical protein